MWRVPSERIPLDLGGPSVEVERLGSWHLQFESVQLLRAYEVATKPEDEYRALNALFDLFVREAQPQWDIVDSQGPVPTTARGMSRLPLVLSLGIVSLWAMSLPVEKAEAEEQAEERPEVPGLQLVESQAPSAVDAVIPPGPANREVKRRLRVAKRQVA